MQIVTAELPICGVLVDIFPSQAFSWPISNFTRPQLFPVTFKCQGATKTVQYVFHGPTLYRVRDTNEVDSCIRDDGDGELVAQGIIDLSKVFEGPDNVPTTPCRRQYNESIDRQYISGFFNSTLQIITIEQNELNIKVDVLPWESLRFYVDHDKDYLFTFRCRGTEHNQT